MKRIDINQEVLDLFLKEDIICFFEFRHGDLEAGGLHGLCKISRPKEKSKRAPYYSLLFIVDTPSQESARAAERFLGILETKSLAACIRKLSYSFLVPASSGGAHYHVRELEVVLKEAPESEKDFVQDELIPGVLAILDARLQTNPDWQLGEGAEQKIAKHPETSSAETSLIARLKQALFQRK